MNQVSVLIYSCDKYSDVWGPFFTLFFRYWNCPYQVYLATESEQCLIPEVKTINGDGSWTERIQKAVRDIPTKYVIGMCEDFFFRRPVNQDVIDACVGYMEHDHRIGCFNFEKESEPGVELLPSQYPLFGRKPAGNHWQKSCQATLWRRCYLEQMLNGQMDPWEWEWTEVHYPLEHYVWTGSEQDMVFEYGYHNRQWFGIVKGKWIEDDVGPLFEKENINIDLSVRGTIKRGDNK